MSTSTTTSAEQSSPPVASAPVSGVPLAVAGFGFSIVTLSLFNIGLLDAGAFGFFICVAIFTGALAMLVGGLWEARTDNVFGATFAVAYACFLLTTGVILQFVAPEIRATSGDAVFNQGFGTYLIVWAIFTAALTVGAARVNAPAFWAFALLAIVYLLAGLSNLVTGDASVILTRVAGWIGLLDGIAAWYLVLGILLNPLVGRELLPVRPLRRA
ncbi:acetate uptake transporter [Microbacterium sp. BWT-B31]|uniref:acetate uptake transporter n=1 Tax=Microbacterium sp. BWT-B31 TaxID=3232072 RepID=UPI003527C75A